MFSSLIKKGGFQAIPSNPSTIKPLVKPLVKLLIKPSIIKSSISEEIGLLTGYYALFISLSEERKSFQNLPNEQRYITTLLIH